jgi:hypothetical protein
VIMTGQGDITVFCIQPVNNVIMFIDIGHHEFVK